MSFYYLLFLWLLCLYGCVCGHFSHLEKGIYLAITVEKNRVQLSKLNSPASRAPLREVISESGRSRARLWLGAGRGVGTGRNSGVFKVA